MSYVVAYCVLVGIALSQLSHAVYLWFRDRD